jgi:transcriptional regulator GlxA family with amidase domain
MTHKVAILALDEVVSLDLGIACELMSFPEAPYSVTVCGARRGRVTTTADFSTVVRQGLRALAQADTVIVPGFSPHCRACEPAALTALRGAYRRGARMVSICTGAFALAQAGILNGRRATTHWMYAEALASAYPAISVDPGVLYVDDGQVLTSAGVASGIDLCLHLIRADHGVRAARAVARRVIVAPHRDGGQAQYIEQPVPAGSHSATGATRAWALESLSAGLCVRDFARHAGMSERTFARRFLAETGTTPMSWLLGQRLNMARELLEDTDLGMDQIAGRCGLGSADNLRLHFRRHLHTTPTAYRRSFARHTQSRPLANS